MNAIAQHARAAITLKQRFFPTCYGPEYVSGTLMAWAEERNIGLEYIQAGKPQQNAYNERYNRTVRGEWLGQFIFDTIEETQVQAAEWPWTYINERLNMGKDGMAPAMKLQTAA